MSTHTCNTYSDRLAYSYLRYHVIPEPRIYFSHIIDHRHLFTRLLIRNISFCKKLYKEAVFCIPFFPFLALLLLLSPYSYITSLYLFIMSAAPFTNDLNVTFESVDDYRHHRAANLSSKSI
jgi:hypothetical protein